MKKIVLLVVLLVIMIAGVISFFEGLESHYVGNRSQWEIYEETKIYTISLIILFLIGIVVVLYFLVKNFRKYLNTITKIVWINKSAHRLYIYVKWATVLSIAMGVILFCVDESGLGTFFILESCLKNGVILFYLRQKSAQEYSEDYLVPQWFKNLYYKHLNNKSELRIILFFIYIPLSCIVPLPYCSQAIVFYFIPICVLLKLYFELKKGLKWIKDGKNELLND